MKCVLCRHGETLPGRVTLSLQRGGDYEIVKGVPAQVFENCGDYYLDEEITEQVLSMAAEAMKKNVEVEILRFAA